MQTSVAVIKHKVAEQLHPYFSLVCDSLEKLLQHVENTSALQKFCCKRRVKNVNLVLLVSVQKSKDTLILAWLVGCWNTKYYF